MHVKLYVPDIECDSCVKLISRKLRGLQGIQDYKVHQDTLTVNYDESLIRPENLVTTIHNLGFRASTRPFERKSFKERARDFTQNRHKYVIEWTGLSYALSAFLILLFAEAMLYVTTLRNIPQFLSTYGLWFLYLDISVAVLGLATWHVLAYRAKITCMVGMMIGMTIGMQTGMLIGIILGATNGFFIGALVGLLLGTLVGAITGKDCGIMGVMEGMMAGVMGGTMGPMISVMMFTDHLDWFMPPYMIINVLITGGLSYLLYEEVVEHRQDVIRQPIDFTTFMSACLVITALLGALMIYGPKNPLISF